MSIDFGAIYPLWRDAPDNLTLLHRLVGEIGLNHVTIPVVTGRDAAVCLDPEAPRRFFATEGGWHYQPDADRYANTPLCPKTARWIARRNPLNAVMDFARRHDVNVIFRVDLRCVPTLLDAEPHLRTRDAWGEDVQPACADVLNPDLRELLAATLDDLCAYDPAGFQLVDWLPLANAPEDADLRSAMPVAADPSARFAAGRVERALHELLCIPFTPTARNLAERATNRDSDSFADAVRARFKTLAEAGNASESTHDELAEYWAALEADNTDWLKRLAARHENRWLGLVRHRAPRPYPEALHPTWNLLQAPHHPRRPDAATLLTQCKPGADLVRHVKDAVERDRVNFIEFTDAAIATPHTLTTVKQATRFARRT